MMVSEYPGEIYGPAGNGRPVTGVGIGVGELLAGCVGDRLGAGVGLGVGAVLPPTAGPSMSRKPHAVPHSNTTSSKVEQHPSVDSAHSQRPAQFSFSVTSRKYPVHSAQLLALSLHQISSPQVFRSQEQHSDADG